MDECHGSSTNEGSGTGQNLSPGANPTHMGTGQWRCEDNRTPASERRKPFARLREAKGRPVSSEDGSYNTPGKTRKKEEVGKIMSKLQNWAANKVIAFKHRDEEGQGLAEYGLILALVAVVCIAALSGLAGGISGTLGSVTGSL